AAAVKTPPTFTTATSFCIFRETICVTSVSPYKAWRKTLNTAIKTSISKSRKDWSNSHVGIRFDHNQRRHRHDSASSLLPDFTCAHHRAHLVLDQTEIER